MKRLILLTPILWGLSALGQPLTGNTVSTIMVRKNTVLAGAAEVVTVQQPGTTPNIGAKAVRFVSAYFDCSVACTFTLERNGAAATSTTLAPVNANPQEVPPTTVAFSASNVGVGSVIASYQCAAACQVPIDLTGVWFTASPSATQNITLRSNSITGTVNILFKYQENANQ